MRALPRRGALRTLVFATFATLAWAGGALPSVLGPDRTTGRTADAADAQESEDACSGGGDPADERRLEQAVERRKGLQRELNTALDSGELLTAGIEETSAERGRLRQRRQALDQEADTAKGEVVARARRSYMLGRPDPVLTLLTADDARDILEQSHVLTVLAEGSQERVENASSAAQRTAAAAEHAVKVTGQLESLQAEYDAVERESRRLLDEAEALESDLAATVANQRAANAARCPLPPGELSGGLACPVDQPRSYSDTWGAARSGGRTHKGVDILAPHGTPIRAFENGTVTRMSSGGLGGISLYMRGDSGNEYYYTHLSGYVSSVATDNHVTAGQHLAYNGDTGNARGIPHLHWEVRPGGGSNVNPYPYARQACG